MNNQVLDTQLNLAFDATLDGKNTETVIERLLSCKETVIVISHNLSDVLEKKFDDTIVI